MHLALPSAQVAPNPSGGALSPIIAAAISFKFCIGCRQRASFEAGTPLSIRIPVDKSDKLIQQQSRLARPELKLTGNERP
jgi:hypothetical protein